jgi:dedA family protein
LNQEKVEKSEKYFDDHGMVATITGRLLPGIRHLISIPAGLAKMSYWKFLLYTTIGAAAWHSILAFLGHYMHSFVPEDQLEEKILEYGEYIKFGLIILVILACLYFLIKWYIKRKKNDNNQSEQA